jgi:type II secretory pathway component PulM
VIDVNYIPALERSITHAKQVQLLRLMAQIRKSAHEITELRAKAAPAREVDEALERAQAVFDELKAVRR